MAELETVLLSSLLADDKAIAVGVMYPGEDTPMGVPLIRVADIVDARISSTIGYRISEEVNSQYRRTQLSGDEVLMTLVGRPGTAIKVPVEMRGWNAARALAVLRLADPQERDFFVYSVASPQVQHTIRNWCNTTVQATLNLKEIKALPLPWPDRTTRRAIAATLGALDDKIELNRKMNATLEAMARALFRDWFVDFGPTRAKMEGGAPYLSPDLWSLFPDRLDDEGKPEGWESGTLGAVATAKNEGVDPSTISPDTPYIGLEHMPRGSVALTDWEGAGKVTSNKAAFAVGDFLFGKLRPYFHKVGIAPVPGICSTDIVVVRPKTAAWSGFVIACISDDDFVAYTDKTSTGTKMPRTSWSIMAKYPLAQPPASLAQAFNASLAPMLERIRANIHESRTLAQTRDLLLPRLMSGELRVSDAQRIAEEPH
jgi:type I restriction enzyme S subunit